MKFGLILATTQDAGYNSLVPRGIGALAAYIERELPQVTPVMVETIDELIRAKPDIVGISSSTECYHIAIAMAKTVKERLHGIPVIIGGIHISLLPESLLPCFDVAVIGEGELTTVELLQSIMKSNGLCYEDLGSIAGLFFRHNGQSVLTPRRARIENLDSLPHVHIDKLPFFRKGQPGLIFSARGCPYNCSFCASTVHFNKYRYNSADYIVQEIEEMVSGLKVKGVVFFDDLLIAKKSRMEELDARLQERNLPKVPFYCQVRANLVDDDICALLKRLNFVEVSMGVESFCDKTLRYYNKSGVTGAINQRAIDTIHRSGIRMNGTYIFGAPDETKDDMQVTFRALYHNFEQGKVCTPAWGLLRPYPGTKIWDEAKRMKLVSDDMDWERFRDWANYECYMNTHMPASEFNALLHEWMTKYTLLAARGGPRLDPPASNFLFRDERTLNGNIRRFRDVIRDRQRTTGVVEAGDDLVLNAVLPEAVGNGAMVIVEKVVDGIGDHRNEGFWNDGDGAVSFTWTKGVAELGLVLAERPRNDLRLEITVVSKMKTVSGVEVLVNDCPVATLSPCDCTTYSMVVPRRLVADERLNLRLQVAGAATPRAIGINDDERLLGVGISEIALSEQPPAEGRSN